MSFEVQNFFGRDCRLIRWAREPKPGAELRVLS